MRALAQTRHSSRTASEMWHSVRLKAGSQAARSTTLSVFGSGFPLVSASSIRPISTDTSKSKSTCGTDEASSVHTDCPS